MRDISESRCLFPLTSFPEQMPTMVFLDALSKEHAWTFAALGLGTALTLGGSLYIYSEYGIRRSFRKYTAVDDLSILGRERKGAKLKGAVVIAGGRYVSHQEIRVVIDAMLSC